MTATEIIADVYLLRIPLERLHESKWNPRKHFDQQGLVDLGANLAKRQTTPLKVRPIAGSEEDFEIAAGHRRRRAAELAGLPSLMCLVQEMTDEEFLYELTIENLQRTDLHALEEAEGYHTLIVQLGKSVDEIAHEVDRSKEYVYESLKLLEMIPEAKDLFLEDKFTKKHAAALARLSPEWQLKALESDGPFYDHVGGLFVHEHTLFDGGNSEDDEDVAQNARGFRPGEDMGFGFGMKPVTVREFEAWIAQAVRFDKSNPDPVLFADTHQAVAAAVENREKLIEISFLDRLPHSVKGGERVFLPKDWRRADGLKGTETCEYATTGVVTIGPEQGEAFKVCTKKRKCEVHWEKEIRQAVRDTKAATKAGMSAREAEEQQRTKERQRQEAEDKSRRELEAKYKKAMPAIRRAIAARVKALPAKAKGPLADLLLEYFEGRGAAGPEMPRGNSAEDLIRHMAFSALATEAGYYNAHTQFPKRARQFGIDLSEALVEGLGDKPKAAAKKKATKKAKKR